VDQPPIAPLSAAASQVFGPSVVLLRAVPALFAGAGTNFVLIGTIVHFWRQLDARVSDHRADRNRMDATSPHLPQQGASKIVPNANLGPHRLRGRMEVATTVYYED